MCKEDSNIYTEPGLLLGPGKIWVFFQHFLN